MSDAKTMVRTTIAFGESEYMLAQGQDSEDLKTRIEAALHAGGAFVDFVVVGNRQVSTLVTPHQAVTLLVENVLYDARDTGDLEDPFGGFFDLEFGG